MWMYYIMCLLITGGLMCFNASNGQSLRFASYYGDHMVLQKEPVRARVWGYAPNVGMVITLVLRGEQHSKQFTNTSVLSIGKLPIWTIVIDPVPAGGPYNMSVSSSNNTISLYDVLFGDVWICSGQSNMAFSMSQVFKPDTDINNSRNYPNVRSFKTGQSFSKTVQEDLIGTNRNWALPSPGNVSSFSAVCWLFGIHLNEKYGYPIGLVETAVGGTRIEAWSSAEALNTCFTGNVDPIGDIEESLKDVNGASALYNSMIHPFFPMPIFGVIWYQGEANADHLDNALKYGCAIRAMVTDWRKSWSMLSSSMDKTFPFGEVQLGPKDKNAVNSNYSVVRWEQSYGRGFAPNSQLVKFFMVVAVDLTDFTSPWGSVHYRFKRPVAKRLALGAFQIAYNDTSNGTFQGPYPTHFQRIGFTIIDITMDNGKAELELRGSPTDYVGFEICCQNRPRTPCELNDTHWDRSYIIKVARGHVFITAPCEEGKYITAVRYLWRESPCYILKQCPLYATPSGNSLPVPPFLYNKLITYDTRKQFQLINTIENKNIIL